MEMLDLSQDKIAKKVGVSQSFVSRLGQAGGEGFDSDKLDSFLKGLAQLVRDGVDNGDPNFKAIEKEILFLANVNRRSQPIDFDPGDFVPVDSKYYIERSGLDDTLLNDALRRPAFAATIQGPVQSGKTSLLRQLEARAKRIGIQTAWFDAMVCVREFGPGSNPDAILLTFLQSLYNQLQVEWALEEIEHDLNTPQRFNNWLRFALATTKGRPRLIVIDDLRHLGTATSEKLETEVLRPLYNLRSQDYAISFAVGRTFQFGPQFGRSLDRNSSIVKWNYPIEVDWFRLESEPDKGGSELTRFCRTQGKEQYALALGNFFQGQPYLTHLALQHQDILDRIVSWSEWEQKGDQSKLFDAQLKLYELMFDSSRGRMFRRHMKSILETFSGPLSDRKLSERLFREFCQVVRKGERPEYDEDAFLISSKLISPSEKARPELARRATIPYYHWMVDYLVDEYGEQIVKK